MEIQKIFSDMYGEERLYSVLMTEDEVALFSEIQKEFGWKEAVRKAAKSIAQTPEVERIASTARTSGRRILANTGKATRGLTDEYLRGIEKNTPIYADSLGKLLNRGAKTASGALKKASSKLSEAAVSARDMNRRARTSEVLRGYR